MKIYAIYIRGQKVKEYPHHLQDVIYLILKGFVYRSRHGFWISHEASIREIHKK